MYFHGRLIAYLYLSLLICLSTSLLALKEVMGDNLHSILSLYMQRCMYAILGYYSVLDTCWFICTLCLVKTIHYYLNENNTLLFK
jgi:hypothetical protein